MSRIRMRLLAAPAIAAALLAPTAALAHPGHGSEITGGLIGGFLHPWTGIDHLVSLLLAGAWAAALGTGILLRLPLTFLLAMIGGFVAAPIAGSDVAEALAAVATVSLVVLAALRYPLPLSVAVSFCALFGFGHGVAHGLESTGSGVAFVAGMVASSSLLMALGMAGAQLVLRSRRMAPVALRAKR